MLRRQSIRTDDDVASPVGASFRVVEFDLIENVFHCVRVFIVYSGLIEFSILYLISVCICMDDKRTETTPKRTDVADQGAAARCDGRHRKYAAKFNTVSLPFLCVYFIS